MKTLLCLLVLSAFFQAPLAEARGIWPTKKNRAIRAMHALGEALGAFAKNCGGYPTTEQGLEVLVEKPSEAVCKNWGPRPYYDDALQDPWGLPWIYQGTASKFNLGSHGGKKGDPRVVGSAALACESPCRK